MCEECCVCPFVGEGVVGPINIRFFPFLECHNGVIVGEVGIISGWGQVSVAFLLAFFMVGGAGEPEREGLL
jgi:hypothetical protein